jgi:hypothetical protein
MSILKTKLKILLVGFIVYQGALLMHKKENGYMLPDVNQIKQQASYGFSSPAYANENTGLPVDIPYSPYMGEASSEFGQMQAHAKAEANRMINTGDTSAYQQQINNDPYVREIMSFR